MDSTGVYGTTIPSRITTDDVEIFYSYRENRDSDNAGKTVFQKLPSSILSNVLYNDNSGSIDNTIEGLYNLKLPLQYFNRKGYYTVYIKPREISAVIADVSNLAEYTNVRGIVLDSNSNANDAFLKSKLLENNSLVGYRVIYINDSGGRENYFRLITSNNRSEPIVQTSNISSNKSYVYRYNDSSTLSFITVTPSTSPSFKAGSNPFIGKATQRILLVNTLFEPVMLDIEITDKDVNTISTMLEGSQLRNLDAGLVTTFDDNNQIYSQSEHYTLKDQYTGKPVYEVKKKRTDSIDFNETLDDKI